MRTDEFEGFQTILDKRGLVDVDIHTYIDPAELDDATEEFEEEGAIVNDLGNLVIEEVRPVKDLADLLIDDVNSNVPKTGPQVRGYHFYIEHGTLKFQMNSGGLTTTYSSGVQLANNQWHHVAVTVDRDSSTGGTFYVDGAPVTPPFNPLTQQASLDNFADVILGRFQRESSTRDGWDLDEVELFHRVLSASEVATLYDAGPAGKCKLDCDNPIEESFLLDGAGASPRPAFDAAITYGGGDPAFRRDVDVGGVNKVFLHTFSGLPNDIIDAKLIIHVQAQGELDYNDAIGLQYTGAAPKWEYYSRIGSTSTAKGLLPDEWDRPRDHTFVLDLDSLTYRGQPADLVTSMNANGYLDVMVQDDTKVHFVELVILRCCDDPKDETLQGGVEDDFDPLLPLPGEPSEPRPALEQYLTNCSQGPAVGFDETEANHCFGHTFFFEPKCLANATVEIRLRGLDGGAWIDDDNIAIGYDDASNGWIWESPLTSLPESGGTWTLGQTATFTIDIGAVSPAVLSAMATDGHLDVFVKDDTSVDYVRLTLQACCG